MSLTTDALRLAVNAALGAWLGVLCFFSFVGAPRAFAVFGDDAGAYVNDVFPRYYLLGAILGLLALVAAMTRGAMAGFDAAATTRVVLTGVAVSLAAYSRWWLVPKMDDAGEDAFATYHRVSVIINGATILAVAMALVSSLR